MGRKSKIILPTEPFWSDLISVYFQFCRDKFGVNPTFEGSAPKDLKSIIKTLHIRAIESDVDWTLEIATRMLRTFLEFAYLDPWIKDNFLPFNLNRQKDKILFRIRAVKINHSENLLNNDN